MVGASGSGLDERYLQKWPNSKCWSHLKYPQERPPLADFQLWQQALWQMVPVAGLAICLGQLLHQGYEVWEWRVSKREQYLLHYKGGSMDVFVPTITLAIIGKERKQTVM